MRAYMDVLMEGLVPAIFEQMRAPLVLCLRLFEGVSTGLLYHKLGAVPSLPAALAYALTWTLASAAVTVLLDIRHRGLAARGRLSVRGGAAGGGSEAAAAAAGVKTKGE
jgi:hypothetical protein